ncbi:MAG: polyprenol monophosphomannose synthase [Verrucomicrobiota bacterium]
MPNKLQHPVALIPTYNESESILGLLRKILNADERLEVLVIDDASPDGTADLVKKNFSQRVHLLRRAGKLGYASACREGIFWALEKDFDAFVIMDADGSHNPSDIPILLQKIEEGADIAAGSRYLDGVRVLNWPMSRLLLSAGGGIYVRAFTGLPLTDPTSGFKAIRKETAEKLPWEKLNSNGYCFNIETYFFAWKKNLKIAEAPIIFTERRKGASKMTFRIMIEAILRVLKLFFYRWV